MFLKNKLTLYNQSLGQGAKTQHLQFCSNFTSTNMFPNWTKFPFNKRSSFYKEFRLKSSAVPDMGCKIISIVN